MFYKSDASSHVISGERRAENPPWQYTLDKLHQKKEWPYRILVKFIIETIYDSNQESIARNLWSDYGVNR